MNKVTWYIVVILMYSCMPKKIQVYSSKPLVCDGEIRGNSLQTFFEKRKWIKLHKLKIRSLVTKEFRKIKKSFNGKMDLEEFGLALSYYDYAFILAGDTLYTEASFSSWRYKKKVLSYKSKLLKARFEKY